MEMSLYDRYRNYLDKMKRRGEDTKGATEKGAKLAKKHEKSSDEEFEEEVLGLDRKLKEFRKRADEERQRSHSDHLNRIEDHKAELMKALQENDRLMSMLERKPKKTFRAEHLPERTQEIGEEAFFGQAASISENPSPMEESADVCKPNEQLKAEQSRASGSINSIHTINEQLQQQLMKEREKTKDELMEWKQTQLEKITRLERECMERETKREIFRRELEIHEREENKSQQCKLQALKSAKEREWQQALNQHREQDQQFVHELTQYIHFYLWNSKVESQWDNYFASIRVTTDGIISAYNNTEKRYLVLGLNDNSCTRDKLTTSLDVLSCAINDSRQSLFSKNTQVKTMMREHAEVKFLRDVQDATENMIRATNMLQTRTEVVVKSMQEDINDIALMWKELESCIEYLKRTKSTFTSVHDLKRRYADDSFCRPSEDGEPVVEEPDDDVPSTSSTVSGRTFNS